ncbi:Hydroxyacylglutathione hydrolase GloC (Accessory type II glyoxalase) (Glyoxalase II 2) (GlxII-2), partial [Durusdinium trenchii]
DKVAFAGPCWLVAMRSFGAGLLRGSVRAARTRAHAEQQRGSLAWATAVRPAQLERHVAPPKKQHWRGLSGSSEGGKSVLDRIGVAGNTVTPWQMQMWTVVCMETKECAIFDCGLETRKDAQNHAKGLEENGFKLTKILQTHAHVDHVAGLGWVKEELGGVDIFLHSDDRPTFEGAAENGREFGYEFHAPLPAFETLVDLKDMETVSVGNLHFRILHTPGHAPGHVVFYEESLKYAVGGDMIFQNGLGRTDLAGSSPEAMEESLRFLVATLNENTTILPGHGAPTSLASELRNNHLLSSLKD